MYLSFRRSKDALLALGFFVLMVVIVFSTLLYVLIMLSAFPRLMLVASRYFIERGTWDDTLEIFINSDGDPSQFAVSPRFLRTSSLCLIDVAFASPYPPQHGMSSLPH
jgi:potassium voltage-gated channel Shal-related subfamily D member 2